MELKKLIQIIADSYNMPAELICGKSQKGVIMEARKIYYNLASQFGTYTQQEIVEAVGRVNHSTYNKIIKKITVDVQSTPFMQAKVNQIKNIIVNGKKIEDFICEDLTWVSPAYIVEHYDIKYHDLYRWLKNRHGSGLLRFKYVNQVNKLYAEEDIKILLEVRKIEPPKTKSNNLIKALKKEFTFKKPANGMFKFANRIGLKQELISYYGIK